MGATSIEGSIKMLGDTANASDRKNLKGVNNRSGEGGRSRPGLLNEGKVEEDGKMIDGSGSKVRFAAKTTSGASGFDISLKGMPKKQIYKITNEFPVSEP